MKSGVLQISLEHCLAALRGNTLVKRSGAKEHGNDDSLTPVWLEFASGTPEKLKETILLSISIQVFVAILC